MNLINDNNISLREKDMNQILNNTNHQINQFKKQESQPVYSNNNTMNGPPRDMMKSINQTNEEMKDDMIRNSLYGSPNDQSNRSF